VCNSTWRSRQKQPDPDLLPLIENAGVTITAKRPSTPLTLLFFPPWVLILAVYLWISGGLPGGIGDFLDGGSTKPTKPTSIVTFAEIAGQGKAKREVSELIKFLRDPNRYQKVGAAMSHGVLLMGLPGTGEILLARSLAGEADLLDPALLRPGRFDRRVAQPLPDKVA
jgi:cell division protease FtsH